MKKNDIMKLKNLNKKYLHDKGECRLLWREGLKLCAISMDETQDISDIYSTEYLEKAEFCEEVDWRKVCTDTRILVREDGRWVRKWFAFQVYNEPYVWEGNDYYSIVRDVKKAKRVRMAKLEVK